MGAPIKINKDLLVITPNYTKKWLSEGHPKVSGLHSQVTFPLCSWRPPSCKNRSKSMSNEIKAACHPSAPVPQLALYLAQLCLIRPLSFWDPDKKTPAHFKSINVTPHTITVMTRAPKYV